VLREHLDDETAALVHLDGPSTPERATTRRPKHTRGLARADDDERDSPRRKSATIRIGGDSDWSIRVTKNPRRRDAKQREVARIVRSTSPKFVADNLRVPLASLSGAGRHCDVIEGERITADQAFGLLCRAPSTSISSRGKWPRTSSNEWGAPRVKFCDRKDFALERVDDLNVAL
jgi:hypothetical protein